MTGIPADVPLPEKCSICRVRDAEFARTGKHTIEEVAALNSTDNRPVLAMTATADGLEMIVVTAFCRECVPQDFLDMLKKIEELEAKEAELAEMDVDEDGNVVSDADLYESAQAEVDACHDRQRLPTSPPTESEIAAFFEELDQEDGGRGGA